MTPTAPHVVRFLGAFASVQHRGEAATELAAALGGEELYVFSRDPEIDVFLPAPGLPQTLKDGPAWRAFISRCLQDGFHRDSLPGRDGQLRPSYGCAAGGDIVLVLLGIDATNADLQELCLAAPILGALIRSERHNRAMEVRTVSANETAVRARELSEAMQRSHKKLQAAYTDVERAKQEAEALGQELHAQAAELEEQATMLEEANDHLAVSEARLRSVIDSSLDAIITIDSESRVTGWNRPAEEMFGWSEDQALGGKMSDMIIPPQYRDAHHAGMNRFLATREGPILNRRIEVTALDRSGREFPVELTVSPSGSGSRAQFSAFVRDISERRTTERRRSVEQEATRILSEAHSVERAAVPLLEAIGTPFGWQIGTLWMIAEDGDHLRCAGTWTQDGMNPMRFRSATRATTFRRGEGLPGRVWEKGSPLWISDVTTDANFPRAQAAESDGLHSAFAFPILAGDTVLGVADFFSPDISAPDETLLEMVGTVGSNLGQSILRIHAEERRDRLLAEVVGMNERLQQMNANLVGKTREAEQAREEAIEANRAKSKFLATMSHELRTPINAVIGYAQLIEHGIVGPINTSQRNHLQRIATSSRHLLMLIEDVLDLARIEAGRVEISLEPGVVDEVVEEALSLVRPQADLANLRLEKSASGGRQPYIGDPDRTRQILVNLLTNAVKFTKPGGTITVTAYSHRRAPLNLAASGEGPWTCVEIEDSGIGISPEHLDRIFLPFEQVQTAKMQTRDGTGLGLTISRHLAQLMGGDISVRSELGKGSRFSVWLPGGTPSDSAEGAAKASAHG